MATHMPKNSRGQRIKQIKKLYDYKEKFLWKLKTMIYLKKYKKIN